MGERGDKNAVTVVGTGLKKSGACVVTAFLLLLLTAAQAFAEGGGEGGGLVHGNPWLFVGMAWLAILFLVALGAVAARNVQKVPGRAQNFLELLIGGLEDFFVGVVGEAGQKHVPILITFFLFIATMNLMGLVPGLKPPTSTLNMTIALSLIAIVYVQVQGILANGIVGYLKHFVGEPWWMGGLMFPLHVIGEIAKPISLSIRLFGNIFGEETVILQLALLGPVFFGAYRLIPIQLPMFFFGLFTSIVQALVFTILVAAYIVLMTAHEEGHGHAEHDHSLEHAPGAAHA